jgi:uncharacterized membrane protein
MSRLNISCNIYRFDRDTQKDKKMKVFQNIRDNIALPPLISREESPQYQSFISKFTLVIIFIFASNVYISVFFFDDCALMMAKSLEEYSAIFARRIEYIKLLDGSSHKYYVVTLFLGVLVVPGEFYRSSCGLLLFSPSKTAQSHSA